jgi:hypothetical protein
MNASIRAALVGAVIGLTEAALAAHMSVFTLLAVLRAVRPVRWWEPTLP